MPRIGHSQHTQCLRTRNNRPYRGRYYRLALNIQEFADLVQSSIDDAVAQQRLSKEKGKKRELPDMENMSDRPPKIQKLSGNTNSTSLLSPTYNWPTMYYPLLKYSRPKLHPVDRTVCVLKHTFEMAYSISYPEDAQIMDGDDGWIAQEQKLLDILDSTRGEVSTLDLGDYGVTISDGKAAVISKVSSTMLASLPQSEDSDLRWSDAEFGLVKDIASAACYLQDAGRCIVSANMKLVLPKTGSLRESEMPFKVLVELSVSLICPAIFTPIEGTRNTWRYTDEAQRRLLEHVYPSSLPPITSFQGTTSSIPFFYSILQPAPTVSPSLPQVLRSLQPPMLRPTLLPFQRRTVFWMLGREGMTVAADGTIVPNKDLNEFTFWDRIEEGNQTWYLDRVGGTLSSSAPTVQPVLGGIIAEEPGLGKTLESISLILLNPSLDYHLKDPVWHSEAELEVKPIRATLIVTPPSLASQWKDELTLHAPSLKVFMYDGWSKLDIPITSIKLEKSRKKSLQEWRKKAKKKGVDAVGQYKQPEAVDWPTFVNSYDVVITTYPVLRADMAVARPAPKRPRREDVVYSRAGSDRPRSPLVRVQWYRVFMDEVQMAGGGRIEEMVSLIPRRSSFAVSGTPARTQVTDLQHVLKFLRVEVMHSNRLWNRLLLPGYHQQFARMFQHYAVRTIKSSVTNELTIPQQTRYLVGINMGKIERHVYDQALEAALLELGLDARGVAATEDWDVDPVILRSAIRRLRAICTHPQVGQLQKSNDKFYKTGALKSMSQVLQHMQDGNWRDFMDNWKTKVLTLIRKAQLKQLHEQDLARYRIAMETLNTAKTESDAAIQEIERALNEHKTKGEILKLEATSLHRNREGKPGVDEYNNKGKGREQERVSSPSDQSDDYDDEYGDLPRTPIGKEHEHKERALKQRLREFRLVLHRVYFLMGDVHHVFGASHSDAEDAAYSAAEAIRKLLLQTTEDDAIAGMKQLRLDATKNDVSEQTLVITVPFIDEAGIKSTEIIEELHEIITDVLNKQTNLLWEWRTYIHMLLTQKLSTAEGEADGQEYQRNLDNQGEAETYLQVYAALLADRREALSNERTLLALHDVREKKLRHTKAAIRAADVFEDVEMIELQPEHEILHSELTVQRKELLKALNGRALKSILVLLTNEYSGIKSDKDPQKILLKNAIAKLRSLIATQVSHLNTIDADLALFRRAFNQRILYFRQLQEISDSVADVELELPLMDSLLECEHQNNDIDAKIKTTRARQRYLDNLTKAHESGTKDDEEDSCILCRCDFIRGFITQCAHIFCEGCLKAWLLKKDGKACPVCRVPIDVDNLQRFTVDGPRIKEPTKLVNSDAAPKSRRNIEYNMIDTALFQEIQRIECFGDFGQKIHTLVRHLLYIQQEDVGAKSIVFSAWADSLTILQRALTENGIRCLRIDQGTKGDGPAKKFKTTPEISVLLLHGERENAGLNITCASRVFLLESVVHQGFEVQAIARIDRMGQTRPTEVFCYYAEDTIEKNILDLASRKGLSLYTKDNAAGTLVNASNLAAEDAKDKVIEGKMQKRQQKGDFISKIDDMLAILFPHMYEDVEFLIDDDAGTMMESHEVLPIAGPSNLSLG